MTNVFSSLLLIFLYSTICYAQKNLLLGNGHISLQEWEYGDFVKNKVNKIEAYTFYIHENGSLKKDSLLLYRQEINPDSLSVSGNTCDISFTTAGYFYYETDDIKRYHNTDGSVHKVLLSNRKSPLLPPSPTTRVKSETVCIYDEQNRLTKKETITYTYDYWIPYSKKYADTILSSLTFAKITNEYTYTSAGKQQEWYIGKDSIRYIYPENKPAYCNYCYPPYINVKQQYDESGNLIGWQSYTRSGNVHSKKYYYYNAANQLIQEVDSTGWAYTNPFWQQTVLYEYKDTSLVSISYLYNTNRKSTTYYNPDKQPQLTNYYEKDSLTATEKFEYKDAKIIARTFAYTGKNSIAVKHTYMYYPNGLLLEEKVVSDGKLIGLVRYHYDV